MEADARADNGADARAETRNMLQRCLNNQRSLNKRVASQPPDVGPLVSPRATPRILAPVGLSCQYVPLSSVASGSVGGGGDELTKLLNAEVAAIGSAGDARAASARAQARPPHLEGAQFGTCAGPGQVLAPQVSAPAQSAPPREAETVATTNLSSPEVSAPQVSTQAQAWLNGPRETALDGTGFDLGAGLAKRSKRDCVGRHRFRSRPLQFQYHLHLPHLPRPNNILCCRGRTRPSQLRQDAGMGQAEESER